MVAASEPSTPGAESAYVSAPPAQAAPEAAKDTAAPEAAAKAPALPARTELADRRTQYSRTYDNHDGTFTTEVSPAPMHYKPSAKSGWQPVDYNFIASADGKHLTAGHNSIPIEVSTPDDAAGFLTVHPRKTISLAGPTRSPARPRADRRSGGQRPLPAARC